MKKLIAVILGLSVMASSVNVQASSTSKVVIGIVGGLVTGMMIKSVAEKMNNNEYNQVDYRRNNEQVSQEGYSRICHNEQTYYRDSQGSLHSTGKIVRVCSRVQDGYNY